MKIAVAGLGYVGLSLAVLLARKYRVLALDVAEEKVDLVNRRICPIRDEALARSLSLDPLDLTATTDPRLAFQDAAYILLCLPTDYDPATGRFDTRILEDVLQQGLALAPDATFVIKSTLPVGFCEGISRKFSVSSLLFCPEFLREGRALEDSLHPSRIILGVRQDRQVQARHFARCLTECCNCRQIPVRLMDWQEAEAVKLFSNAYLALRIGFFNELDSFAAARGLDALAMVEGVCLDSRIGMHYNNPSFGYGGYCLPKDTRQLEANFDGVPQALISAISASNARRKDFLAQDIARRLPSGGTLGIYGLAMKAGSDDFRCSAVFGLIRRLHRMGISMTVYDPSLPEAETVAHCSRIRELEAFKAAADLILANRRDPLLEDVAHKVYSRDLFGRD